MKFIAAIWLLCCKDERACLSLSLSSPRRYLSGFPLRLCFHFEIFTYLLRLASNGRSDNSPSSYWFLWVEKERSETSKGHFSRGARHSLTSFLLRHLFSVDSLSHRHFFAFRFCFCVPFVCLRTTDCANSYEIDHRYAAQRIQWQSEDETTPTNRQEQWHQMHNGTWTVASVSPCWIIIAVCSFSFSWLSIARCALLYYELSMDTVCVCICKEQPLDGSMAQ